MVHQDWFSTTIPTDMAPLRWIQVNTDTVSVTAHPDLRLTRVMYDRSKSEHGSRKWK